MTRQTNTARNEDSRSTRDLVLDIAERLFAEKGFAGVSMREITAEAGLRNQASLYHHFRHKRALYEAVMARGIGRLVDLVTESGKSGDILDRVIDFLAERPHLPRLIQRVGLDDHRYLGKTVARLLSPLYEQGIRVLAGMGGPWKPAELVHVAAGLYNMIFGYFANAALFEAVLQEDLREPAAVARQRRFVRTALARLLETGPDPSLPRIVRPSRRV